MSGTPLPQFDLFLKIRIIEPGGLRLNDLAAHVKREKVVLARAREDGRREHREEDRSRSGYQDPLPGGHLTSLLRNTLFWERGLGHLFLNRLI